MSVLTSGGMQDAHPAPSSAFDECFETVCYTNRSPRFAGCQGVSSTIVRLYTNMHASVLASHATITWVRGSFSHKRPSSDHGAAVFFIMTNRPRTRRLHVGRSVCSAEAFTDLVATVMGFHPCRKFVSPRCGMLLTR